MQRRKNMAQILFYVYALIILFSPSLVVPLKVIIPSSTCDSDYDCLRYEEALNVITCCNNGLCVMFCPDFD
ncbi:putative Late nodulin [Medicago truncatula]|uniref:Putative Late nodulin n=1 Tax=Medicago truncatula TaxID=3880 RepID=A0A396JBW2_MEDTR|nr:putative Late nodulin [Medicago truncatula]